MFIEVVNISLYFLLLSPTKADESFERTQFTLPDFRHPYRVDRFQYRGRIIFYISEDTPSKLPHKLLKV